MNPVEMLCFIGTRGMGALNLEPVTLEGEQKSILGDRHAGGYCPKDAVEEGGICNQSAGR